MQYLLTFPIMVLAFTDNHQAAVTLPAGALVDVVGPVEEDDRFLVVNAEDGQFHIFASDLADRATPVVARKAEQGSSEESAASEPKERETHERAVAQRSGTGLMLRRTS